MKENKAEIFKFPNEYIIDNITEETYNKYVVGESEKYEEKLKLLEIQSIIKSTQKMTNIVFDVMDEDPHLFIKNFNECYRNYKRIKYIRDLVETKEDRQKLWSVINIFENNTNPNNPNKKTLKHSYNISFKMIKSFNLNISEKQFRSLIQSFISYRKNIINLGS